MLTATSSFEHPYTKIKCLVLLNRGSETLEGTMYAIHPISHS